MNFPEGLESPQERELLLESLEFYRRGLAEAPVLRKWEGGFALGRETVFEESDGFTRAEREADTETPMTFVISSEEVDRHGDLVLAQGWRLQAYLQNPVFLWAHNYGMPAIGRALAVWPEPGQLLARLEFAPTGFAGQVAALYRGGYQQGVSVGFRPLRYEERRDAKTGALLGIRFLEQELLEVSAVPVPANRNALLRDSGGEPLDGTRMGLRHARREWGAGVGVEEILVALRTGLPGSLASPSSFGEENTGRWHNPVEHT